MDSLFGDRKLVVPISSKDLWCKNECGFYGNMQWQGFCSKCWREYLKQLNAQALTASLSPPSSTPESSSVAETPSPVSAAKAWGFDKFLEKKNLHTNRRSSTLRQLLTKSPSSDNTRATSSTSATLPTKAKKQQQQQPLQRQLSIESQNAKETFFHFLRQLPGPVGQDVSKQVKHAVDRILQHTEVIPIDELSEMVRDLYQVMNERLRTMLPPDSKHTVEEILDEVEQYLCSRCYNVLFCSSTDEEVADVSLQDRIRCLNWVTCGFLDSGLALDNPVVRDRVDAAVTEIVDMNSRRGPQQKLNSIIQCSKLLFEALKESAGHAAGADEFLPSLIYVILKSNPPLLQSNINFITRFAVPPKADRGPSGYFFSSLCMALDYVQNLNADSLKMPLEEFQAYTSGDLIPPLNDVTCRCQQAIKSLEHSLDELKLMKAKAQHLSTEVLDKMMERQDHEWAQLIDDLDRFTEMYPPPKSLDDWLEASPEKEQMLPSPLVPTVVGGRSEELKEE